LWESQPARRRPSAIRMGCRDFQTWCGSYLRGGRSLDSPVGSQPPERL